MPGSNIELGKSVGLPTMTQAADNAVAEANTLTNFSVAAPATKVSEVAGKLQAQGIIAERTAISNNAALTQSSQARLPADAVVAFGENRTREFKVTISQSPEVEGGMNTVVLEVMPTIQENRGAQYDSFQPLHHPGEILKYKFTSNRSWGINAKLIARTVEEATTNLLIVNTIRSWAMPFYGDGTSNSSTMRYLGAPPPILTLSAYGEQMIGPVKCVLENYSWDWPNDIDFIRTEDDYPFPVVLSINLTLKESWSPSEYSGFDLVAYRNGNLPAAYTKAQAPQPEVNQSANAGGSTDTATGNAGGSIDTATAARESATYVDRYGGAGQGMRGVAFGAGAGQGQRGVNANNQFIFDPAGREFLPGEGEFGRAWRRAGTGLKSIAGVLNLNK
jgi:hypothetical protein